MIDLIFTGWFQCRLATDPDPYDEPRGVSGYVLAYADEPDLDRLVSFQPPAFVRGNGPTIGVTVRAVRVDGAAVADHPLVGGTVDLLGQPVFEGRNGVLGDDGLEPIYPFDVEVTKGPFRLARGLKPADPEYPYDELLANGVEQAPAEIAQATGIANLRQVWEARRTALRDELGTAVEPRRTGIAERLAFLDEHLNPTNRSSVLRFFGARMRFLYSLGSPVELQDPEGVLSAIDVAHAPPWPTSFWFGGWDSDAQCAFATGVIRIDGPAPDPPAPGLVGRRADRRP